MLKITVVNRRLPMPIEGIRYKIGRGESALANPFRRDTTKPAGHTLPTYWAWLWKQMNIPNSNELAELYKILEHSKTEAGVLLVCWCKPAPCHGDVIKEAIKWLDTNSEGKKP